VDADAAGVTSADPDRPADRTLRLRYAGTCRTCGAPLAAGVTARYERSTRTVRCLPCVAADEPTAAGPAEAVPPPAVQTGTAGASAAREHDRRAARREERIRAAHPRLGGLILAVSEEPQSTRAWGSGAAGERVVARSLEKWTGDRVRLLHDRRIPRSRANIDHLAVTPSGVYVIDAKRYRGRPDLHVQGGLIRPRTSRLVIGGRDGTRLVAGVQKQVALVRDALGPLGEDLRVRGMLCFVDADWPLIGGAFAVDGVDVLWPKKAAQVLDRDGPVGPERVEAVHRLLAAAFAVA
jgi:hypothetical protein